jgi:hypothetical protein
MVTWAAVPQLGVPTAVIWLRTERSETCGPTRGTDRHDSLLSSFLTNGYRGGRATARGSHRGDLVTDSTI